MRDNGTKKLVRETEWECKYGQMVTNSILNTMLTLIVGSVYEGFWKNDKANGKGRLIHAD